VITGGKGSLAGPVVGGLIFGFLPVIVRPFAAPAVQWILYGGLTILIVFVLPRGLVPTLQGWIASRAQSKGARDGLVWAGNSEPGDAKR
jgi:branched-chain amino acid transport system permease protein